LQTQNKKKKHRRRRSTEEEEEEEEEELRRVNLMCVTLDYTVRYRDLMTTCGELMLQ
jgi:hypothetical protein